MACNALSPAVLRDVLGDSRSDRADLSSSLADDAYAAWRCEAPADRWARRMIFAAPS